MALGAGASFGFGLPSWDELMARIILSFDKIPPTNLTNEEKGDWILHNICNGSDSMFAAEVKKALYKNYDLSLRSLVANQLLSAVGALAMASFRGSVNRIISFNFDDILERYLRCHGFVVRSIASMPAWNDRSDVEVFHPHGILESDVSTHPSTGIVLAQIHFDRIVGKSGDAWRNMIIQEFRSRTCLFLGLSGRDPNLTSILTEVKETHVSKAEGAAFWGVRFVAGPSDATESIWEARGVFNCRLNNYDELPGRLLEICQASARLEP